MSTKPLRKAVLPVAGLGTRVLPATKAIPKEMLPVFDRPAIQYVVDEALAAGIEHIVFVTGRNKMAIEDYFDRAYELEDTLRLKNKTGLLQELESDLRPAGSMSFVRQQSPMGLGHAVWCARDLIGDEPFAVMLPDMLMMAKPSCLAQMKDAYDRVGGNIIAVEPTDTPEQYGVIEPESRDGRLLKMKGMVEKPKREAAPSNLFISGRYILQPDIFELLGSQQAGAGGEIQLTDAMARLMKVQSFHALEYEGRTYDCGDKLGYLRATAAFALAHEDLGAKAADTLRAALAEKKVIVESFQSDCGVLMALAASQIAQALKAGLTERGSACAALSGGTTPGPAYGQLATMQLDWPRITFALVDERCVPASDPASNEGLLRKTLAPALAAGAKVLPMYTGSSAADAANAAYASLHIDIALMGMGEDAHTASWFPGGDGLQAALDPSTTQTVVAVRAPQAAGAAERLTLTRAALDRADRVLLLIAGQDKRDAFDAALKRSVEDAPVTALLQRPGRPLTLLWAP